MTTRTFALLAGIVYLLVGILGFVPGAVSPPPAGAPDLTMQHNYGYLLAVPDKHAARYRQQSIPLFYIVGCLHHDPNA